MTRFVSRSRSTRDSADIGVSAPKRQSNRPAGGATHVSPATGPPTME